MPPTFSSHSASEFSHLHREIQQTRTGQASRLKVICHASYASKYPGNLAVCGTITSISSAQKGREMLRKSKTGPGPTGTIHHIRLHPG